MRHDVSASISPRPGSGEPADPPPQLATTPQLSRYTTAALALGRAKQHWQYIITSIPDLGSLSYYQLLDVGGDAAEDEISAAYYELVRVAHPDRHARERDPKRKQAVVLLYARMGEAHRVLTSPELRRTYDRQLTKGANRLTRDAPKPTLVETRDPKSAQARQLYDQARQMIREEDFPRARANLDLALQFEPDSKAIRQALDDATPAHLKRRDAEPQPAKPVRPARPAAAAPAEVEQPEPPAPEPPAPAPAPPAAVPPSPRASERRLHERHEIARPVRVRCRKWSEFRTLYTRDISRGGVFLRTAKPLGIGTSVQLALALPDERVIELRAKVAHVVPAGTHGRPAGMGLRFIGLDSALMEQIEALLGSATRQAEAGDQILRQLLEELTRLRQASASVALNVPPDADPDVVRKSYLHLAKRTHPDLYCRYPGEEIQEAASEVFYLIRSAYERMRDRDEEVDEQEAPIANGSTAIAGAQEAWHAGDFPRARTRLRYAVDAAPKNRLVRAAYHVAAGCEAAAAGKHGEAHKHFESALVFDDTCEEALRALASDEPDRRGTAMFDRIRDGEKPA